MLVKLYFSWSKTLRNDELYFCQIIGTIKHYLSIFVFGGVNPCSLNLFKLGIRIV